MRFTPVASDAALADRAGSASRTGLGKDEGDLRIARDGVALARGELRREAGDARAVTMIGPEAEGLLELNCLRARVRAVLELDHVGADALTFSARTAEQRDDRRAGDDAENDDHSHNC